MLLHHLLYIFIIIYVDVSLEGLDEEEKMMKLMGFSNFDTTKVSLAFSFE